MSVNDDLYIAKIFALLHDPPYKSYCIYESIRGGLTGHEKEAKMFREKILKDTVLKQINWRRYEKLVREADTVSSGFDRLFLDFAVKTESIYINYIANIFNPKYYEILTTRIPSIDYLRNISGEIAEEINGIIKKLSEKLGTDEAIKTIYITLYALLEPLCYIKGLIPSLADTRIPTHTVMDHLYATAMTVNLLFPQRKILSGYLIFIDFPGIHEFVDAARKSGDFWAGSWIISEVIWKLAEKIINIYGPDVIISPTLRMNPYFYFKYLKNILEDIDREVYEKVKKIAIKFLNKLVGYSISVEDIMWQPLIPGTLLIALPKGIKWCKNRSEITNNIINLYYESWNDLIRRITNDKKPKPLQNLLYKVLEKNRNLIEKPPIGLRIFIMDIEEVCHKLISCLKGNVNACKDLGVCSEITKISKIVDENFNPEILAKHLAFHVALSTYLRKKTGIEKIPSSSAFWIYKDSENRLIFLGKQIGGRKNIGWTPCSQCALEPAILVLRKKRGKVGEYNDRDFKELYKLIGENEIKMFAKKDFEVHFKPGEAIGPYCLLKRIVYLYALSRRKQFFVSTDDIVLNSYKEFVKKCIPLNVRRDFIKELVYSLVEILSEKYGILNGKVESLRMLCQHFVRQLIEEYRVIDIEVFLLLINELLKKEIMRREEFFNILSHASFNVLKNTRLNFEDVLRCYFEHVCEYEYVRDFYEYCIEKFYKNYREEMKYLILKNILKPSIRYAIVYADGDNVGKIHCGYLPIKCKDYINMLLNLIKKYYYPKNEEVERALEKSFKKICEILKIIHDDEKYIPVSPTYKAALSASIMITALKDIVTVAENLHGMTIFSGGDDLIALTPIDTLSNVLLFRKNYEGHKCFHEFNKWPIVSAIPYGRSLSIHVANLSDLMSEEIARTNESLESKAKRSVWTYNEDKEWRKDALVISFSRSKTMSCIPLKNSKDKIYDELIKLLSRLYIVFKLYILSPSLPEDFEQKYGRIRDLISRNTLAIRRIIDYIFRENITIRNKKLREEMLNKILGKDMVIRDDFSLFNTLIHTYKKTKDGKQISSIFEIIDFLKLIRILRGS